MSARFEIVQTDADQPWHARIKGGNGETVWVTENYEEKDDAEHAFEVAREAIEGLTVGDVDYIDERTEKE